MTYSAMMCMGVMLGEVVCLVLSTRAPNDVEVSLIDSVTNPVVPHVDRFRSSLLHFIICDAPCAFVVCGDWGGRLGMTEVVESGAEGFGVFGVVEERAEFCFGCGGKDVLHRGRDDVDRAIDGRLFFVGPGGTRRVKGTRGQEEMAACPRSCVSAREI